MAYREIFTTVFAENGNPKGGNPCPVVLDADGLSAEEMRAMAEKYGFETVFVSQTEKEGMDWHFRYFVPLHEMSMCVHATIGATTVLATQLYPEKKEFVYETMLGAVHAYVDRADGKLRVQARQFAPKVLKENPPVKEVCEALHITAADLADLPVESCSTSRQKLIVPLKSRELLDQLTPDSARIRAVCEKYGTTGFYPFAQETAEDGVRFYARQFPMNSGYPEDAATGVACSALGVYLIRQQVLPAKEGWNTHKVYQGQAMGRPSFLESRIFLGPYDAAECGRLEKDADLQEGEAAALAVDGRYMITETRVCGEAIILPGLEA